MDRVGISQAVIAPEDREIAVDNAAGNDRILHLAEHFGDRFIPACTVNPWFAESGCRELRRAVRNGARMLILAPALQGFYLTDTVVDHFLDAAAELRVPVYVHTGPHSSSAPAQLALTAAHHTETNFIMGHCGATDYWRDIPVVAVAGLVNLWYETSFCKPWKVLEYMELAGHSRVIFGTAAPRNDTAYELRCLQEHLPIDAYAGFYANNLSGLFHEDSR
jgi:predicted TIM-barrel fold metal-dependent hydrolase